MNDVHYGNKQNIKMKIRNVRNPTPNASIAQIEATKSFSNTCEMRSFNVGKVRSSQFSFQPFVN